MDTLGGGGDCTNFTSQCLLAGGWPMDYRESGYTTEWWYRRISSEPFDGAADDWWSCTWSLPENQFHYLTANHGTPVDLRAEPRDIRLLDLADLIFYDWDEDGLFDHGAIITSIDRFGRPLVTYRTLRPLDPVRNGHWSLNFRRRAVRIVAVKLSDAPVRHDAPPAWSRLRPCESSRANAGIV